MRNCLVEFEVIIHNVFISGYSVENVDDPRNNRIDIIRRKIINSIRSDIGTQSVEKYNKFYDLTKMMTWILRWKERNNLPFNSPR